MYPEVITDTTLNISGKSADAATVGEVLATTNSNFPVKSATLNSGSVCSVPYPNGFTKDNCIAFVKFKFTSTEYYMHFNDSALFVPKYIQLNETGVSIHTNNTSFYSKDIDVYFIKFL